MNKSMLVIACILFCIISMVYSFDPNKGYHTLSEISRSSEYQSSIDSYDVDFNLNPDSVIDFADKSNMAFNLYYGSYSIDESTICRNDKDTCDSRFYPRGSTAMDSDLFNGLDINDFCLVDKSTCPDAYKRCDQSGVCENIYLSKNLDVLSCSFGQDYEINQNISIRKKREINISRSGSSIYVATINDKKTSIHVKNANASSIRASKLFVHGKIRSPSEYDSFAVMYIYGFCNNNGQDAVCSSDFPPCPSGWQESGCGARRAETMNRAYPNYLCTRTCYIFGKGYEVAYFYGLDSEVADCPDGWIQAGYGPYQAFNETTWTYARTCYNPDYVFEAI